MCFLLVIITQRFVSFFLFVFRFYLTIEKFQLPGICYLQKRKSRNKKDYLCASCFMLFDEELVDNNSFLSFVSVFLSFILYILDVYLQLISARTVLFIYISMYMFNDTLKINLSKKNRQ
jgi:hypothetical protein